MQPRGGGGYRAGLARPSCRPPGSGSYTGRLPGGGGGLPAGSPPRRCPPQGDRTPQPAPPSVPPTLLVLGGGGGEGRSKKHEGEWVGQAAQGPSRGGRARRSRRRCLGNGAGAGGGGGGCCGGVGGGRRRAGAAPLCAPRGGYRNLSGRRGRFSRPGWQRPPSR